MKNILIYTKTGTFHRHKEINRISEESGLILFFILFLCGMLIGCAVYKSEIDRGDTWMQSAAEFFLAKSALHYFISACFLSVFTILCSTFASCSCFGLLILFWLPMTEAFYFALQSCYLLEHYAVTGLGYFSLIILPSAVLQVTASLYLYAGCLRHTKALTSAIMEHSAFESDWPAFFKHVAVCSSMILASAFLRWGCAHLFGPLF